MQTMQTTCNYCSLGCNFDVTTDGNEITKIIPSKNYPVNKGFSCIKGLNLDKQGVMNSPEAKPRIKDKDGNIKHVSWDEAFKYTASKLNEIKEKYGSQAIAGISTGQLDTEGMAIFGHVVRNFLGGNLDGNTRLCMATSVVAHKQCFGFDAPPYTLNDFELSDTIFLIGANPIVAHPIIWDRIKENKIPNKKVIVIDPRKSETAKESDYWFGIKPKSDIYLFYTVANILIEKDWINKEYIENYTENFEGYKEHVKNFPLNKAKENTGLSEEQVMEIVNLIHNGKNVSFWWTMGVNQGYEAVRTAQSIIALALLTGNIGRAGTGANSITGQCNAMGSRAFSNTAGLYGGGDFDNPKRREAVSKALGIDEKWLPQAPTITYNAIIEKAIAGEIKALWICCTNPRHSWVNNETFKKAIENLELFIVQDIYDDTDSSEICSVYFPVTSGLYKEGVIINTERRLSKLRPVLMDKKGKLTDYEVFYKIGEALGMGDLLKGWETPRDAFELMKKCSKGMPCDISGVDYDALNDSMGIQWPYPEGNAPLVENERRLFENNQFYTPTKKAKFMFEMPIANPIPTNEKYPYILNTGRGTVGQWHTQTRTRELYVVNDVAVKVAYAYISEAMAIEKDIKNFDFIEVESINGQKRKFMAFISDSMPDNQIYAPIHYIETNALTPSVYDSYSKEPSYKTTPVNVKKAV